MDGQLLGLACFLLGISLGSTTLVKSPRAGLPELGKRFPTFLRINKSFKNTVPENSMKIIKIVALLKILS